ncbi:MAG: sulfur carrier protein ThiS [Synergistaceae bacterium]|jgi:sulfur carrier protein|nr:sulfur carrier protein ThiS [Synergistaceae bacterium]
MIRVNGEELSWCDGMTVQDVLDAKNFTFRMISVWINEAPVEKREDYPVTKIPDGAEVEVVHMISGGQAVTAADYRTSHMLR